MDRDWLVGNDLKVYQMASPLCFVEGTILFPDLSHYWFGMPLLPHLLEFKEAS